MRYKLMGRSGLRVSELCLGTMTFGDDWGWGAPEEECRRILEVYREAGGNFVDTAVNYTNGSSEQILGRLLADYRDEIVLATKYTVSIRHEDVNACGNHRKNMMQSLHRSLKQLNTDYIDLYWVHIWDFLTPVEEVMRALDDMVRAGKVLYVGISDTPAWIVSQANTMADLRGWTPFVGLQIEYSLAQRTVERELLPMARTLDLGVTPWGCLGAGTLTGKYNADRTDSGQRKRLSDTGSTPSPRRLQLAEAVAQVAQECGRPAAQVALNWVRQQPGVIVPILGARSEAQMRENLGCLDFDLSDEQLDDLDEASSIEMGFPHDFWAREGIQKIVYSGKVDDIDDHHILE
ncbi:MAG: aldo/keto reductase [Candidatus Zixiibacteriota bacterium]|nr:MAG: aldo/keto reductase [candidate division Zixibacteria bacterium]